MKSHIRSYVDSDGKEGQLWKGFPALLLTTRGRKSGKLRRTALIYGRDGKDYLLVASNGGSPNHPMWYLNLSKNPEVEIQVGAEKFKAQARTATAAEKPRLWKIMAEIFPRYDLYQEKAGREDSFGDRGAGLIVPIQIRELTHPQLLDLQDQIVTIYCHALYRTRGWVVLCEDLFFTGVPRRYQIMGLELNRKNADR